MSHQDNIIDSKKKETWDEEFMLIGYKVKPESALNYELEQNLPSFVFIEKEHLVAAEDSDTDDQFKVSHLTFFMRDNEPMEKTSDGGIRWFEIEPMNMSLVLHRIHDILPDVTTRSGVEGFLVPLQESDTFDIIEDANAYMHNLMFWESIISPNECGPLIQRLSWLSQKLYSMRGELFDVVMQMRIRGFSELNIATDSVMELFKAAENLRRFTDSSVVSITLEPSKTAKTAKTSKSVKTAKTAKNGKAIPRRTPYITFPSVSYEHEATEAMKSAALMRQNEILQNIDMLKRQLVTETDRLDEQSKLVSEYYDSIIKNLGNGYFIAKRTVKGRV